jgi:hypothetical protein
MEAARHNPFDRVATHPLTDAITSQSYAPAPVEESVEPIKEVEKTPVLTIEPVACSNVAPAVSRDRTGRGDLQGSYRRYCISIDQLGAKGSPKHGLSVDVSDGTALLVDSIGEGLVREWNKAHPNLQVSSGDRIIEVTGVHGDAVKLRDRLSASVTLTLVIFRPRWLNVKLSKAKGALGLDLHCQEGCATLLVKQVGPGIVKDWNDAHQDLQIIPGDRIAEVNGTRGSGASLKDALSKQDVLELRILVAHIPSKVGVY